MSEKHLLEELASCYEQLSIFYDWNEQLSQAAHGYSDFPKILGRLTRATDSLCGLMISMGRGRSVSVIASWSEGFEGEQRILEIFKKAIPEIESKFGRHFFIKWPFILDDLQGEILVIPWRSDRTVKGVFIFAKIGSVYTQQEALLLGNSSVELAIMMEGSTLSSVLKDKNYELELMLIKDLDEFQNIFKKIKTNGKHLNLLIPKSVPSDIKFYIIGVDENLKWGSSPELYGKNASEIFPAQVVLALNSPDNVFVKNGNLEYSISQFKSEFNQPLGWSVIVYPVGKRNDYSWIHNLVFQHHAQYQNDEEITNSFQKIYTSHLLSMGKLIDAIHPALSPRVENIISLSQTIGKAMGLSDKDLEILELSATFIDIPLLYLDSKSFEEYIISGTKIISPEVLERIKNHPIQAAEMVSPVKSLRECVPVVLHHHERWDGLGYPKGLKGEEIPKLSRIISLAQSLVHRTTNYYLDTNDLLKLPSEQNWLAKQSGRSFDPAVIDALFAVFNIPSLEKPNLQ